MGGGGQLGASRATTSRAEAAGTRLLFPMQAWNSMWLDLQEGKRKISHLSIKELKLSFCDYGVTSKESQENASQEFLTLNPKVTFKILTHPICITQERHLHRTYL